MKIAIVGPGIMPIPPKGWGAVEILVWDYKCELEKLGHEVLIVNTGNREEMIKLCNDFCPDFVHIQYDNYFHIVDEVICKNIAITSHYGYLEQIGTNGITGGYMSIFEGFKAISDRCYIFCLSKGIQNKYIELGIDEKRTKISPNGARKDLFRYSPSCQYPDRTIYLAKIDYRKRQYLFQNYNANIYFAGNNVDNRFNEKQKYYLGEWGKEYLYNNLTNYANMALLSDGEADPLATKEALMAGLGLVLSEFSCANLDLDKPYISVIPENKIQDKEFVKREIENNRKISVKMKDEIREYAINNFSWEIVVKKYENLIKEILYGNNDRNIMLE